MLPSYRSEQCASFLHIGGLELRLLGLQTCQSIVHAKGVFPAVATSSSLQTVSECVKFSWNDVWTFWTDYPCKRCLSVLNKLSLQKGVWTFWTGYPCKRYLNVLNRLSLEKNCLNVLNRSSLQRMSRCSELCSRCRSVANFAKVVRTS